MNISSLSTSELRQQLKGKGVYLRTGPFVTRVQSPVDSVARSLALLYSHAEIQSQQEFADFHVRLAPPRGWRRWLRPQVNFSFDGWTPFIPLPIDQAFPMFEWGANWCIANHAHRYLIIHAAVLEKNGYAVIMPAPPGSGKSTLCAALAMRGWRLLSDELTILSMQDGRVVPLARPVGLKNQSIEVIRRFCPDAVIGEKSHDTSKGTVAHMKAPAESVVRDRETALPGWIVFPRYAAGASTRLELRSRADTLMKFIENAFNYSVHGHAGFRLLVDLVDRCNCHDFTYSDLSEAIEVFDGLELPAT